MSNQENAEEIANRLKKSFLQDIYSIHKDM